MESLSDTLWDVVISGTGLQQSLLALALSRSGKNILHVDPNDFYGGSEAAFSLQEIDEWAEKNRLTDPSRLFSSAEVKRDADALGAPRSYSLALAPQLIHSRSKLVTQLVDSKAFRQIEFLAVGSFYIFQPPSDSSSKPSLSRIPSTREDVFSDKSIPARSKRSLMKFLKFVLEFDSEPQIDTWQARADEELAQFLASEFKLDAALQSYIITLTLSHDGKISVKDGLTAINRHMTSMGVFGPGFAAVYPKWGGLSEVAQVGCRAAAVGGAIYMLGHGIKNLKRSDQPDAPLELSFTNDIDVKAKLVVQGADAADSSSIRISRLTAVTKSNLSPVFELRTDGAPTPAVAVVAFPSSIVVVEDESPHEFPVYAMVHSSDTGECPSGQYVIYLSTVYTKSAKSVLKRALSSLIAAVSKGQDESSSIYQVYYEQSGGPQSLGVDRDIATFSLPSLGLAFDDSILESVHEAWKLINAQSEGTSAEYMQFEDREGVVDDDPFD
ncbi:rab geranylgeranyl transferase component A [Fusarium subglutinans]|uniref:Rab proteins geranylgeranyltransferase n=1 Tax=Gibberella subglutinans TaxID=42677 RepID=A0A8H5QFA2_GIBSU|nr:rab geranylgeranyl transferase component A [Fusarium subglutinans]KAF5612998.1 rab geranylgeranyl transferase component A [Fusarium subglutinans]